MRFLTILLGVVAGKPCRVRRYERTDSNLGRESYLIEDVRGVLVQTTDRVRIERTDAEGASRR